MSKRKKILRKLPAKPVVKRISPLWLAVRRCALILTIVVIDQLSKLWARVALFPGYPQELLPVANFDLHYNSGAAFSLLDEGHFWQLGFLILVSMVAIVLFIRWLLKVPHTAPILSAGLILLIAGALGNLIDRLVFAEVTDFISLHWQQWYFPTFNVADASITFGVILMLLGSWLSQKTPAGQPGSDKD